MKKPVTEKENLKPVWVYALLFLVIVFSGYLHFSHLHWNTVAWPHPDERAMISQTYDMLVSDNYEPTNFTWGHLGYYSVLFTYKGFLYLQNFLNGVERGPDDVLRSVPAERIPHLRDLLSDDDFVVPMGIVAVLLCCGVYLLIRWISKYRGVAALLLALVVVAIYGMYPWLKGKMLVRVQPNYDDVAMLGRFMSAFTAVLSVPVIYLIGKKVFSARVGLLAAAFLGFTALGMQLGRFYCVDMLQAFCILLAVWGAVEIAFAEPNPTANSPRPVGKPVSKILEEADNRPEGEQVLAYLRAAGAFLGRGWRWFLRCDYAVTWTTLFVYLFTGVAIGMALASKFSSMPILVIPLVAHVNLE